MKSLRLLLVILIAYAAGGLTVWMLHRHARADKSVVAASTTAQSPTTRPTAIEPADHPRLRTITNSIGIIFVRIEPGEFLMGSPQSEPDRGSDEAQHRVTLTKPYFLATTPVTQKQWLAMMTFNPSAHQGDDLPVEQVTWEQATDFCRKMSAKEGKKYRLPTEAEWEYACRAGTTTEFYTGTGIEALKLAAWYEGNSNKRSHPVGQKKSNAWGLFDMHGNVWQFCQDGKADFTAAPTTDPLIDPDSASHVVKGGGWTSTPDMCRSASRGRLDSESQLIDVGLRLCLEAP